jgi:phospholipase C
MVGGAAATIGAAAMRRPGTGTVTDAQARLLDDATAVSAAGASLGDVEHVVILMQENRSFDPTSERCRACAASATRTC